MEQRNIEGPINEYPIDSFMIVLADNIDYVHNYARSFSRKQGTSWHGSTVQVVQPKPLSMLDSRALKESDPNIMVPRLPEPIPTMSKCSYSTHSPNKSSLLCSPCPKRARRKRTGMECTQLR